MLTMSADEFRHIIKIYRPTISKDEDNVPTKVLELLFTTKGKVTNVRGTELQKAKGTAYLQEKRVYFRTVRSKPVRQDDIVEFNDEKYNITFVNDVEELGRYTELKMELVK
ncbi:phage head closure protein [Romboutsia ilealis]|uniref:phage head closure protein n=1 Tax=Romboutsia ilealis TaxID=1115758 RepID=UPI002493EC5B|nr:phage head closure protein [Romboutsia ilealis]